MKNKMKKHLKKFGCGILIGISNLIPGFSGGTMALILGVLEELTFLISSFTKTPFKTIKELWSMLLGIACGIIIATFTVVLCLEKWPLITASFFVGLVIASIPIVFKETNYEKPKTKDIICFIICFLISLTLPFLKLLGTDFNISNPNILVMLYIFVVATFAAATMIIPAASGSLIMLAFGIFTSILEILKDTLMDLVALDFLGIVDNLWVLIPFGLGCIFGVILISKVMAYAFKKHRNTIWYGILGLLITSIFTIYYDAYESHIAVDISLLTDNLIVNIILSVVFLIIGIVGLRTLIKFTGKIKEKNSQIELENIEEEVA